MSTVNIHELTGGACRMLPGPCKHSLCRYHADSDDGPGKNRSQVTPKLRAEACTLDAADERCFTLLEIGQRMGRTRERVRQIELKALKKILTRFPELRDNVRKPDKGTKYRQPGRW